MLLSFAFLPLLGASPSSIPCPRLSSPPSLRVARPRSHRLLLCIVIPSYSSVAAPRSTQHYSARPHPFKLAAHLPSLLPHPIIHDNRTNSALLLRARCLYLAGYTQHHLNQPSLYLTTCSRTHPLQCRDIKTAEAFEASNAAVAVEYYTKARDLIAPLLGVASPQMAYYQDMYAKVNARIQQLSAGGGGACYHSHAPAVSSYNPYSTPTAYQYGAPAATPAYQYTSAGATYGYDQTGYAQPAPQQTYYTDPSAYAYQPSSYSPAYGAASTYDPAAHYGSSQAVAAYSSGYDPAAAYPASGSTAVYTPTTHYPATSSAASPASSATAASSYAALLSGVKPPTASPVVASTGTPISAAASAAFVAAHNASAAAHSTSSAPSSSSAHATPVPSSSASPATPSYYPHVPTAAPYTGGSTSAPSYPSRDTPAQPNFQPFASASQPATHGAQTSAADAEMLRKQQEELRQIEEQKRRQAEELRKQQEDLRRIEMARQQQEEELRKRDEEIRRREEAARQKEESLRLKDESVRKTEEMLRQREAAEQQKEQERLMLQARLQDELRRAEEARLQYETRRTNEMAQLEAERQRLEQQRLWAAAEAAEKDRRLQAEVARREEEAKKFKDDIEKERYMLQARQAQVEATLAQEREKLKLEEERLKKELELKYRGEAELKIRAQEERIQAETNAARQREAQALREQYERRRAEEEASMRQLKDQSLQQQQEVAARYREQEQRMQMELEAKYKKLAEQRLLDEEARIRLEYQEQLNAAEKERQRQEETRRQEEERRARAFEAQKGEESAKLRSMAEELERVRKRNEEVEKERQRVELAAADARKKIEEDARRRIDEETKKRVQAESEAAKKYEEEKRRTILLVNQQQQNSSGKNLAPNAGPVATGPSVPEPAPLQGYMKKMGEGLFAGWKKRWFYTYWKEKRLYYADSENESHPAGFVDLTKVKAVAASQSTKFGIDIITPNRVYYCATENESERKYWVEGLRSVVAAALNAPAPSAALPTTPAAPPAQPAAPKSQPAPVAAQSAPQASPADIVRGPGAYDEKLAKLQAMDKEARDALQRSSTAQAGLEKLVTFYAKDPAAQARAKQQLDEETAKRKHIEARVAEIKEALVAMQPSLRNTVVMPKAAPPQPPARTDLPKSGAGQAKALFDFVAEGPNEISFKKGDTIVLHEATAGADWWFGEVRGATGSFPASYVEMTKKPDTRLVRADALYDNQAQNQSELSFQAGDILTLLEYQDGEEWWKGEVGGQVGYFPANYVAIRKD